MRLNLRKCVFLKKQVVYLGLRVDGDGLHPVQEKIDAIKNAPPPKDVSEFRSFLEMVQYYSRFLPGLATTLAPLHQLLKKDVQWRWTGVEQRAYEKCKAGLSSDALLVHYDAKRDLRLPCDASSYVISHVMDDGQERPIAFASRTLSASEKNYAQVEKEAFTSFCMGADLPLQAILGPKSEVRCSNSCCSAYAEMGTCAISIWL